MLDFFEEWREAINVAIIQEDLSYLFNPRETHPRVGESMGKPLPWLLGFDGFSVHAYIEVLRFLDRVKPEISLFDAIGGVLVGDPIKPLAYLACSFYNSISRARCKDSLAATLKDGGWRLVNDGFGDNWQEYTWEEA